MKCYNRTSQEELKYEALQDKNQDSNMKRHIGNIQRGFKISSTKSLKDLKIWHATIITF